MNFTKKALSAVVSITAGAAMSLGVSTTVTAPANAAPAPINVKLGDGISSLGPLFGIGDKMVNSQCTLAGLGKDNLGNKLGVTAAHCVENRAGVTVVKGGLVKIIKDPITQLLKPREEIGKSIKIISTIDLSKPGKQTNVLDVALIKLNDNVHFTNSGTTIGTPAVGDQVFRLGNGIFSPSSGVKGVVKEVYPNDVKSDHSLNANPGDSGGGVYKRLPNGTWVLLGVLSRSENYFTLPGGPRGDYWSRMDTVLNILNSQGGVGAGFHSAAG